jgi:GTP:adenosylcobinamide-phosphate guanylyltransferase
MNEQVDALILAGGDGTVIDPVVPVKGLVPIAGRPMTAWVLDALRAASSVRRIVLIAPESAGLDNWADVADDIVLSNDGMADNIAAGLDALTCDIPVIGVTSDIPMLTAAAVDDLVAQTFARKVQLSYPLMFEDDLLAQFPGSKRTFIKIKDGRVTGGNAMVFDPALFRRLTDFAQKVFDARKSPLKLARIVGPAFVGKLVAGQLDPGDVERRLHKLLDAQVAAVYTRHACLGADVDKPADVAVAVAALRA